jgi:hypothetical protein
MWANDRELAREFQSKTPKGAKLPEHVGHTGKRKKQDKTASSLVNFEQLLNIDFEHRPVGRIIDLPQAVKLAKISATLLHLYPPLSGGKPHASAPQLIFCAPAYDNSYQPPDGIPNDEKRADFIDLTPPEPPVGVNSVDPTLQKLAAILSPALAAMFGQQQTTQVPDSIKGTSLDPNSEAGQADQQPIQPPQSDPNQVAAAFLPPGAQPPGQGAPMPPQGQPTDPPAPNTASPAPNTTPLAPNQGINANPIDRNGALGGSGIGGMANMQYMPKHSSARESMI